MDAFYEESAIDRNSAKGAKKYKLFHVISLICLAIAIFLIIFFILYFPFGGSGDEVVALQFVVGFFGVQGLFFLLAWFMLRKFKARFNVSYDYCFVSGELRISKVFNINRRKLVARIQCEDILQIGDTDNPSYERFRSDPSTKEVVCTPNVETSDGKFFMYVLTGNEGKKLYVLECREALLINIMKFARRGVLESDYVMQEKKQRSV